MEELHQINFLKGFLCAKKFRISLSYLKKGNIRILNTIIDEINNKIIIKKQIQSKRFDYEKQLVS